MSRATPIASHAAGGREQLTEPAFCVLERADSLWVHATSLALVGDLDVDLPTLHAKLARPRSEDSSAIAS